MENMKAENFIEKEVKEKVKSKSTPLPENTKSILTQKCDVLYYNHTLNVAAISFNGFGYEIKNVTKNPGNSLTVKYKGKPGNPSFKIWV